MENVYHQGSTTPDDVTDRVVRACTAIAPETIEPGITIRHWSSWAIHHCRGTTFWTFKLTESKSILIVKTLIRSFARFKDEYDEWSIYSDSL